MPYFYNTFPSFSQSYIRYHTIVFERDRDWDAFSRSRRCYISPRSQIKKIYTEVGIDLIERCTLSVRELFTLALLLLSLSTNKVNDGVQSYIFDNTSIFLIFFYYASTFLPHYCSLFAKSLNGSDPVGRIELLLYKKFHIEF